MVSPPSFGPRFFVLASLVAWVLSDCGPPPVIHNGVPRENIDGISFPPGSTVVYKCLGNFFNVHGKLDVVTCLSDSKWSPIEQFCVGSCMSLPRSEFAQVKKGQRKDYYIANTTVVYICRQGYDTIPEITPVITCQENYTWTQIPAFCKGKSCGDPGKPEHGDAVILTDLLYLAKVNFTCEDGYRLNGSSTTQCQWKEDHVEWTQKPPECQRQTEKPTEDRTTKTTGDCTHLNVQNARLRGSDPKDSYPVGTNLRYQCIPGYEPIPGQTLSVTCLDTSKWSIENPKFCQGRRCPTLSLENGRIIKATDLRLGDEITLGCNEGYRIIGQNILRCILIGNKVDWNRELPLCQRIPCFPPPDIPNGVHTGSGLYDFDHGTAITYACNRPYSLIGNQTIYCLTAADGINGEWRPAAPECKVVSCPRPKIENGGLTTVFQPSYSYGNRIIVVCNRGYTLVGSYGSNCGADSEWNPPLPKCLKVRIFTTTTEATTEATTIATPGNTTGSTHSPETKPPTDDSAPNRSPGVIIGSVVAVLLGLCLIAAGWKYRSCFIKGKSDPSSSSAESYRAVATHTEIGLEPNAS